MAEDPPRSQGITVTLRGPPDGALLRRHIEQKKEDIVMKAISQIVCKFSLALVAATGIGGGSVYAGEVTDPNVAPNPYHMEDAGIQLPLDRKLGAPIGVEIDHSDGKTLWLFDRCGADTCIGSNLAPIMKFDATGKMVANFGSGLINWPHGFYVDRDGNAWITDGKADGGKGHTVIKFAPDGRV